MYVDNNHIYIAKCGVLGVILAVIISLLSIDIVSAFFTLPEWANAIIFIALTAMCSFGSYVAGKIMY